MGTLYLFEVVLVYDTVRVIPIPHFVFKGSLVDLRLRATFSPARPERAETRSCPMRAHSDRARSASKEGTWLLLPLAL